MEKGRYSIKMLIGSILAGVVFAVIGEILYQALHEHLPRIVMAEIYFVGLFLFLGLAIWMIGKTVYSRSYKGVPMRQWIRAFLAMLVLTAVFEFIYEIQFNEIRKKADAYIFVIDSSGSMSETDPDGLRFKAIENMLEEKPQDFRYAVYLFSDDVIRVREIAPQSNTNAFSQDGGGGGTAIKHTLETLLEDIQSKKLDISGLNAHVILLSDGFSTDINFFNKYGVIKTLNEYAKEGISISTVGLLDADEELMTLIAEKTGGVFVNVDDVQNLDEAMAQAGNLGKDNRHLLGFRNSRNLDLLYAVMRILFITGLGIVIGLEKAFICEKFLDNTAVIKSSAVGSALAGMCIEAGMNGLGIHPALIRLLVCILISFTLLREDFLGRNDSGAEVRRSRS